MKTLHMDLGAYGYGINIGKGLLSDAGSYFNLERKVFILTDSGVPSKYSEAILSQCKDGRIFTVSEGEGSKSIATLNDVLSAMCEFNMTRQDALVAVGGGVVGDLAGFAASIYMRGIDFYNVPTTSLSMIDSSIGGKTAVNLGGIKNVVGSFYQPRAVLIDTDTLSTLSERQIASGLAEAVKMAITMDEKLFLDIENAKKEEIYESLDNIIARSLMIKKAVVEKDEREVGLRKVLNFGHTLGHGIEATSDGKLYHGECVSLGMIPMCQKDVRERLVGVLSRLGLPTSFDGNADAALDLVVHDKKCKGGKVSAIYVDRIGSFEISDVEIEEFKATVKENLA